MKLLEIRNLKKSFDDLDVLHDISLSVEEGEVVAIGTGRTDDAGKKVAMDLKVGDKVLYGKYSGTEVKLNDEEYLIMRESDVYAVIG